MFTPGQRAAPRVSSARLCCTWSYSPRLLVSISTWRSCARRPRRAHTPAQAARGAVIGEAMPPRDMRPNTARGARFCITTARSDAVRYDDARRKQDRARRACRCAASIDAASPIRIHLPIACRRAGDGDLPYATRRPQRKRRVAAYRNCPHAPGRATVPDDAARLLLRLRHHAHLAARSRPIRHCRCGGCVQPALCGKVGRPGLRGAARRVAPPARGVLRDQAFIRCSAEAAVANGSPRPSSDGLGHASACRCTRCLFLRARKGGDIPRPRDILTCASQRTLAPGMVKTIGRPLFHPMLLEAAAGAAADAISARRSLPPFGASASRTTWRDR